LLSEDIKHQLLNLDPNRLANDSMVEEYTLPNGETITMTDED